EIEQPHACDSSRLEDSTDGTAEIAILNPPQETTRQACPGRELIGRDTLIDTRLVDELSQKDRCICGVTGIRPVLLRHLL
nr:hypothetical protein [Bradyrhizobium sp.]